MDKPADPQSLMDLKAASADLRSLVLANHFPELRVPIERLSANFDQLVALVASQSTEPDAAAVSELEKSVEYLYRTSVAQTNIAPQKYQQPIFQCYSDYQKCVAHNATTAGKTVCLSMFVLSIVNSFMSISLTFKK
jgi:hypothetical protein